MAVNVLMLTSLVAGTAIMQWASAASAQTLPHTFAQERAAAKSAGIELSAAALSPAMPPPSENAALIYEKLDAIDRANIKERDEMVRNWETGVLTQSQRDTQILENASRRPDQTSATNWLKARQILEHRAPELVMVRAAARRPKCVFGPNEFASEPGSEFEMNVVEPAGAEMREAARLLLYESLWEAHDRRPTDAIRDLSLGFGIARQAAVRNNIIGYLNAEAIYAVCLSGFKSVLRMYAADPTVCRAVRAAIAANWKPKPLSDTVRIETAIDQGMLDAISKAGPQLFRESKKHQTLAEFDQKLDAYCAYELHAMQSAIAIVDKPYPQSAPALTAIFEEAAKKYPVGGDFPSAVVNFADVAFHRDGFANAVRVTDAGAAVLIYRAEHGKFPTTLADAMQNPPTDAFDSASLHYEMTATGFIISATHQRPGHKPEPTAFQYPLPGK